MASYLLRLPDDLHRLARIAAASKGLSLQAWILGAVRGAILHAARAPDGEPVRAALEEQQ